MGIRSLVAIGAVALAAVVPASASATTVRGTVVHRVSHAHSFVVATHSGALRAVHSAKRPAIGRRVAVRVRRLANGTFAARSVRVAKHGRRHARLRGVVTTVSPQARAFVLSARGVSLVVHHDASEDVPDVGSTAVVDATLNRDDELEADDIEEAGQKTVFELEGLVKAVDPQAGTITMSSDDEDELGSDVVVAFPAGTDLSPYVVGAEVQLRVSRAADGSLSAIAGCRDEHQGDDDHADGDRREHQDGEDGDHADQPSGEDHGDDGDRESDD